MILKTLTVFAALSLLSTQPGLAAEDPKVGSETYYGSGYVEKAPEFGEVRLSVSIQCGQSAAEVQQLMENKVLPVWKTITSKILGSSETDRHQWGDIQIGTSPESNLVSTPPSFDPKGNLTPGSLKRYLTCGDKREVALDQAGGLVYSGSQTLVVRSSDLNWLESLVQTLAQSAEPSKTETVQIIPSAIRYDVSSATKRAMRVEVQKQARLAATGPGSKFESDAKTLRFTNAKFVGQHLARPPEQDVQISSPIARGQAPLVEAEVPFVYVIYAEAPDRLMPSSDRKGLVSEYRTVGRHQSKADFAEASVTVTSSCHLSAKEAADAIQKDSADVLAVLKSIQGAVPSSEEARVTQAEITTSTHFPYSPSKWATSPTNGQFEVLEQLDRCTGKTVAAPKQKQSASPYYMATQTYSIRTRKFDSLNKELGLLRSEYGKRTIPTNGVFVTVGEAYGNVTNATKQKILQAAREDAAACLLDPAGSLAADAQAHGFSCAHLRNLRVASVFLQNEGARGARFFKDGPMESAQAPGASASDSLEVEIIQKEGDLRGMIVVPESERHYAFEYEIRSEDYVPALKTPVSTPKP